MKTKTTANIKKSGTDATTPATPESAKTIETRRVATLEQHPMQELMFHTLSGADYDRLRGDIEENGLRDPIEITTDDVVIDGHQRLRVIRDLRWGEVAVWVRYDLTDDRAIEQRHIDANLNRRQLDVLDLVRLAVRNFELKKNRPRGGLSSHHMTRLKSDVARAIGKTPRHTARLLNISEAPMAVQGAFSQGTLSVVLAEKVRALTKRDQEEIAAEISAGADPNAVVTAHLPKREPKPAALGNQIGKLTAAMTQAMETIAGRERDIERNPDLLDDDIEVLERFTTFSRDLLAELKKKRLRAIRVQEQAQASVARFQAEH